MTSSDPMSCRALLAAGGVFFLAFLVSLAGPVEDRKSKDHPPDSKDSKRAELDQVTSQVAAQLPHPDPASTGPIPRNNFIDEWIFSKMEQDKIPHAGLSSDPEFFRRIHLDLTGLLPSAQQVREFLQDSDPKKREKLIDRSDRCQSRSRLR